jgi:hypothetical protein
VNPDPILRRVCGDLDQLLAADPASAASARLCEALNRDRTHCLTCAAEGLAQAGAVAIVTGFCIADAPTPAAETDGPPSALYLASLLAELGTPVLLVSDDYGRPLLEVGCDALGLPRCMIHVMPFEAGGPAEPMRATNAAGQPRSDAWVSAFLNSSLGRTLTHLVAIERPGPSHTAASAADTEGDARLAQCFEQEVPPEDRDICHNMRGASINGFTAKTHRLFEIAAQQPAAPHTIGVGDRGNEIGFGAIPWHKIRHAIGPGGPRIACRIATTDLIVGHVSDYAGYALAVAVAAASARPDLVCQTQVDRQRRLIEAIVRETNAVDGVTRRREATVDGLPLERYLRFLRLALELESIA